MWRSLIDLPDLFFCSLLSSTLLPLPLFLSLLCVLSHHRLRNRSWQRVWVCCCGVTRSSVTKCFSWISLPSLKPSPPPPTPLLSYSKKLERCCTKRLQNKGALLWKVIQQKRQQLSCLYAKLVKSRQSDLEVEFISFFVSPACICWGGLTGCCVSVDEDLSTTVISVR